MVNLCHPEWSELASEIEGSRREAPVAEIPPLRSQARFGRDDRRGLLRI